jgi:hypothetical protein
VPDAGKLVRRFRLRQHRRPFDPVAVKPEKLINGVHFWCILETWKSSSANDAVRNGASEGRDARCGAASAKARTGIESGYRMAL